MNREEKEIIDKMNKEELNALWKKIQEGHVILSHEGEMYLREVYRNKFSFHRI